MPYVISFNRIVLSSHKVALTYQDSELYNYCVYKIKMPSLIVIVKEKFLSSIEYCVFLTFNVSFFICFQPI